MQGNILYCNKQESVCQNYYNYVRLNTALRFGDLLLIPLSTWWNPSRNAPIRLIDLQELTDSLLLLSHRHKVRDIWLFCRYFNGGCFQVIANLVTLQLLVYQLAHLQELTLSLLKYELKKRVSLQERRSIRILYGL